MMGLGTTILRSALLGLVLGSGPSGAAQAAEMESGSPDIVPVELWDRPRSGRALLAVPAVRHALTALSAQSDARLRIHHPPGVEGTLQAEELRAWLIAHAIPPERLLLRGDGPARQPLRLEIVR
jgi:hypothetical protein